MRGSAARAHALALGAVRQWGRDLLARRHQVRLAPPVARWSPARKIADTVLVRLAVGGADRDDALGVAGVSYADGVIAAELAIVGQAVALVAVVAGRGDQHDPAGPQAVAGLADGG